MKGEEMAAFFKKTETLFKLCLLVFFSLFIWTGRSYNAKSRLFPELLCITTFIFIVASLLQDFIKAKRAPRREIINPEGAPSDVFEEKMRLIKEVEEKSEDAGYVMLDEKVRKKRLWQSVVIILISIVIAYLGGFLLTVPFYFISFGILHGQKKQALKYILIAFVITLVTYLGFTTLMEVPLLSGLLWE